MEKLPESESLDFADVHKQANKPGAVSRDHFGFLLPDSIAPKAKLELLDQPSGFHAVSTCSLLASSPKRLFLQSRRPPLRLDGARWVSRGKVTGIGPIAVLRCAVFDPQYSHFQAGESWHLDL